MRGEISGMVGTNVINNQLQTGDAEMPTILSAMKDSGAIGVGIEDDGKDSNNPTEVLDDLYNCNDFQYNKTKFHQATQTQLSTVFTMTNVRLGP